MGARVLDVRGAKCPIPIVKAKKEIDLMQPGERLQVLATDPGSVADFQGWAKTSRTAVLVEQTNSVDEAGRHVYSHLLERRSGV